MSTPPRGRALRSKAYEAEGELRDASTWVEVLGRIGYVAKGIVYAVVGLLAIRVAMGSGGRTEGAKGAIREIGTQPFGRTLLGILAVGLCGYAVWRLVQAAMDTEIKGNDATGLFIRAGYAISGLIYLSLGFFAGQGALGSSGGGGDTQQQWSARLMAETGGQLALGLIGVVVIGVGLGQLYKAFNPRTFMTYYDRSRMSEKMQKAAKIAGQAGMAARCVTFAVIGWFLIRAAWTANAGEVKGLDEALALVAQQSYGKVLLGLVAIGVIGFAVHCVMQGAFRRFRIPAV